MNVTRRTTLKGALAFSFVVGTAEMMLTPREARAAGANFQVLNPVEVRALEALGDALLPGAKEAGIAHFVDRQLAVPAPDCLLLLRYLDVPPPYVGFYRAGLAALDASCHSTHGRAFADLPAALSETVIDALGGAGPPAWQGPPPPLLYFVLRSDAVDVVYGTPEGFARLGVPYMPHIMPAQRW